MGSKLKYDNITFEFDAGQLPPPFCYRYTIIIKREKENFDIEFAIDYYDRQEISEEEILAEGFSMEDDFYWKGKLPNNWIEAIEDQVERLINNKKDHKGRLKIYTTDQKGNTTPLVHQNYEMLEYFLQELIQGIYELNGKQEPLSIKAIELKGKTITNYNIHISFLNREAILEKDQDKTTISWSKTKEIMEQIFGLDYDPFNASKKLPKQNGFYIDPGEGLWYQANKTVKVYDSDKNTESILKEIFK